ncbi:MAG TPA: LacI family DNA-binding transcriptional regulator, partial [Kineosporiaceae bacterium]
RVEWQLYELDNGELRRCPPKDDSYRTIDTPEWLSGLLQAHVTRSDPKPCPCHGRKYVFRGHGAVKGKARQQGAHLADVARRAGVSTGTVSNVLNHPDIVTDTTLAKVKAAIEGLGYVRGGAAGELAAHWRRSGFAGSLFQPAVTGWYPKRGSEAAHPVPLLAEPWPGIPVRGRHASRRAELNWLPIAPGLTPHSLRHTHKTLMEELSTPHKLMDERMGHEDGSVQARYSHITAEMRRRLLEGLTQRWCTSLRARQALSPRSPLTTLDALLRSSSTTQ